MPFSISILLFFVVLGGYHLIHPQASWSDNTLSMLALLLSNYALVILLTVYLFTLFLKARGKIVVNKAKME